MNILFQILSKIRKRISGKTKIKVSKCSKYINKGCHNINTSLISVAGSSLLTIGEHTTLNHVHFEIQNHCDVEIGENVVISNVSICVSNASKVTIGQSSFIDNVIISITSGELNIGGNNILSKGEKNDIPNIVVTNGTVQIADHNVVKSTIWIRFGGHLKMGRYNCVNEGSEIRSDESVSIGSYNMISYNCDIWDTNTHFMYDYATKTRKFEKDFPIIGLETNKPNTKPVIIGDGNWIGKYACILKGSIIKNDAVIGTRTVVSNQIVDDSDIVVSGKNCIIHKS